MEGPHGAENGRRGEGIPRRSFKGITEGDAGRPGDAVLRGRTGTSAEESRNWKNSRSSEQRSRQSTGTNKGTRRSESWRRSGGAYRGPHLYQAGLRKYIRVT